MTLPENLKSLTNIDLNDLSENGLVLIIPLSKSQNFPLVEKLSSLMASARGSVNGREVILCVSDLTSSRQCDLSMEIINIASSWKGFSVIARRNVIPPLSCYQVLSCMIESFQCINKKAHCHTRVSNASFLRPYVLHSLSMVNRDGLEAILPCKLVSSGFYDPLIDASLTEQYQAHAVSQGIHWCPHFDESLIRVIDGKVDATKAYQCDTFIEENKPT
ncbi:TPA: hypothetical protein R2K51_005522 [Raoultella ornithinolytica]|nr:hypothetical protein [Raoultella ornithinolytica]